jgi:hypothetical protein
MARSWLRRKPLADGKLRRDRLRASPICAPVLQPEPKAWLGVEGPRVLIRLLLPFDILLEDRQRPPPREISDRTGTRKSAYDRLC